MSMTVARLNMYLHLIREAKSKGKGGRSGCKPFCTADSACRYAYDFDDDGNQTLIKTSTGIWSVTYNGENRPVLWECVSPNSSTPNSSTPTLLSKSFDRIDRRVTKNDQRFVYDGYLQIANFERASTNSQLTTYNSQLFIWDSNGT